MLQETVLKSINPLQICSEKKFYSWVQNFWSWVYKKISYYNARKENLTEMFDGLAISQVN